MVEKSEVVQPAEVARVPDGEGDVLTTAGSAAGTGGLDKKVAH